MNRAKPRGLYYSDDETRLRVARAGGKARAEQLRKKKELDAKLSHTSNDR